MFRRQPFDRVNPRHVIPSRHTIFIRGLAGSTDVTKIKDFFSNETSSKCSIDFFSTSEDRKRLSVAIRFKSHDAAKDMLTRFNNKLLLGFPVEVTWFKDLKKARAKMFEDGRMGGGRPFNRPGFRGNFRGNDRRGIATSPGSFEGGRRMRAGSSSSGGGGGGAAGRSRYSQSRSRSYSGSSSRSGSHSGRSDSGSPRTRNVPNRNQEDLRKNIRGFSDGQRGGLSDREITRNQSYRSRSGSSSSSRSSSRIRSRRESSGALGLSSQKGQPMQYQHARGNTSPLNFNNARPNQQLSDSMADYSSFSNAPAPDVSGGSSLVSGLIQLKRRNLNGSQETDLSRRKRQASIGSSSSGASNRSLHISRDKSLNSERQRTVAKHLTSLSPPFTNATQPNYKSHVGGLSPSHTGLVDDNSGFPKRKRQKRVTRSPDSLSPPVIRGAYVDSSKRETALKDQPRIQVTPSLDTSGGSRRARRDMSGSNARTHDLSHSPNSRREGNPPSPNGHSRWRSHDDPDNWSQSVARAATSSVPRDDGSASSEDDRKVSRKTRRKKNTDATPKGSMDEVSRLSTSDSAVNLVRDRKDLLAQDYKRDCEVFTTVVRAIISVALQFYTLGYNNLPVAPGG